MDQQLDNTTQGCLKLGISNFLYFEAQLKPLETKVYFVKHILTEEQKNKECKDMCAVESSETELKDGNKVTLENDRIKVSLNNMFLPKHIEYFDKNRQDFDMIVELHEYHTEASHSDFYVFQPRTESKKPSVQFLNAYKLEGPIVSRVSFFGAITSDMSSNVNDFIEIDITLNKGSEFPIIT